MSHLLCVRHILWALRVCLWKPQGPGQPRAGPPQTAGNHRVEGRRSEFANRTPQWVDPEGPRQGSSNNPTLSYGRPLHQEGGLCSKICFKYFPFRYTQTMYYTNYVNSNLLYTHFQSQRAAGSPSLSTDSDSVPGSSLKHPEHKRGREDSGVTASSSRQGHTWTISGHSNSGVRSLRGERWKIAGYR